MNLSRPALLVLVRHGESQRNVAKKGSRYFEDDEARKQVQGVPDHQIPLTDLGWKQARISGEDLKKRFGTFDYVYNSGYRRTKETMDGLLEAYTGEEKSQMQIRENMFIRERD